MKRKETPDEWLKKTVAKQKLAQQKRELELKDVRTRNNQSRKP